MCLVHPEIPEILQDRIKRRHRHRSPHIHGVMKIHIHNFSRRHRRDLRKRRFLPPAIPGGHDHRSAPSHRPCSRIRPLIPIFQRKTELLLCRCVMAGSQGQHPVRISGIYAHGPQAQRLSHGRAGSVKAEQRNFQIYRTEGSGNQLSQKIPCKEVTHLPPVNIFLLQRQICRLLLHGTLCLFPVFHSKHLILLDDINFVCQRSLAFLLSRDRSPGCHKCGMFKPQTCLSHLHISTPFRCNYQSLCN